MDVFKVGDIVARKSYGGDIHFVVAEVKYRADGKPDYVLRGLTYRIEADSDGTDLVLQNVRNVRLNAKKTLLEAKRNSPEHMRAMNTFLPFRFTRGRQQPGRILQIDSSGDFLEMCLQHYKEAGIRAAGKVVPENQQPEVVRRYLEQYKPDLLVVTGHDALKKGADKRDINSYRNSKYYIQSAKEARKFEPNPDRMCVWAGACQSYFEEIMAAGANFGSAPGRVLINALDPAIVSEKVATTSRESMVSPEEAARLTISGPQGVGGVRTKGQAK